MTSDCPKCYIHCMRLIFALIFALAVLSFAETPAKADSAVAERDTTAKLAGTAGDSIIDTVYLIPDDGIPWNRSYFPRERLLRKSSIDQALSVGFTYSASFTSGPFGSFAQQSYLAHLAYEFTPDLHLYADLGLWMPLYANFSSGAPIAKEDVRQGKVEFVLPAIALEYKPTENSYIQLMLVNENDARKAYGPLRYYYGCPWRKGYYCR